MPVVLLRRKPVEGQPSEGGGLSGFPGFMIAKPVSQVAAGNVNSGQHAIGGGFALLFLLG
jgi:hypothetical protein